MKEIQISKIILQKRKEKGLTQDALAEYMGVTKASVSKWETSQSFPDITLLPKLASFFNITIDDLLGYLPQMDKLEIRRTYIELSEKFGKDSFDKVYEEVLTLVEKYYSCFPLLLQMSLLLLNHYMLAEEDRQKEVLDKIVHLLRRVKGESEDIWLMKQATSLEAMVQMILGDTLEVLELLEPTIHPLSGDEVVLANAYAMRGEMEKATSVLQMSLYQHMMSYLSIGASYLMHVAPDQKTFETALERILPVVEIMNLKKLHPNILAQIAFACAHGHMLHGEKEETLKMLRIYTDACKSMQYPYKLSGDEFFTGVSSWMEDMDLGNTAPRGEKVVKEGMLKSVEEYPLFLSLKEEPAFRIMLEELRNI
jgi:transcriptional regulator with XRE-family HTH domain